MADRGAKRKATKNPRRNMCPTWLDEFKDWLEPVEGDTTSAYCKICTKEMNAELTQLERHQVNIPMNVFAIYRDHCFFFNFPLINI